MNSNKALEQLESELVAAFRRLITANARAEKFNQDLRQAFDPLASEISAAKREVETIQEKLEKKIKKQVAPSLVNEVAEKLEKTASEQA